MASWRRSGRPERWSRSPLRPTSILPKETGRSVSLSSAGKVRYRGILQIVLDHPYPFEAGIPRIPCRAWAKRDEIARGHDENETAFYPLKKLIELGGKLLLVGCVEFSPGFSTVHRVQEDLGLADKTLMSRKRICAVQDGDHVRWFERRDISGCSAGFGKFYSRYEAAGILRSGPVGGAYSIFADAAAAYRVEHAILEKDPDRRLLRRPFLYVLRPSDLRAGTNGQIFSFRAVESVSFAGTWVELDDRVHARRCVD